MRRLLAHRDARLFLAGQSLSLLGDTALWLALGLWVKDLTGSSSAAGLVFLCIVAPRLAAPARRPAGRPRPPPHACCSPSTRSRRSPSCRCCSSTTRATSGSSTPSRLAYGASYVVLAAGQSALLHTLLPPDLLGAGQRRAADRPRGPAAGRAGRRRRALHGRGRRRGRAARRRHVPRRHRRAARAEAARAEARSRNTEPPRDRRGRAPHPRARPTLRQMVAGCALCMLVIGFGETLIFELPHALGKPDSFVGVLMAVQGDRRDRRRAHRHARDAPPRRDRAAGFGMTIFALGCAADGRQRAAGRLRRQGAVRPRPAVDRHRAAHAAAAQHAVAPAGPRVRGERVRARRCRRRCRSRSAPRWWPSWTTGFVLLVQACHGRRRGALPAD